MANCPYFRAVRVGALWVGAVRVDTVCSHKPSPVGKGGKVAELLLLKVLGSS